MTKLPIYPFLFALFPLTYLFSINVNYTNLWELPRAVAVVLIVTGLFWLIVAAVLRNWHKGAALAAIVMVAMLTYGPTISVLKNIGIGKHLILAPIVMLVLLAVFISLWLTKKSVAKATYGLNVVSVCLVAVSLFTAATSYDWSDDFNDGVDLTATNFKVSLDELPDMYYIVPDAYGRSDILKHRYNYDNSEFLDALRDRGFYIADQATCNYWMTLFSMSSSMTMDYHRDLEERFIPGDIASKRTLKRYLRASVAQGPVISDLRKIGYTIVSFSSGFSVSETVDADIYISSPMQLTEYEQGVINMTPLRWILPRLKTWSSYTLHRKRANDLFDHFDDAAKIPGPKFVLIHLPIPHPPFVFGANGEDVSPYDKPFSHQHAHGPVPFHQDNADYLEKYKAQTAYTSKRLVEGVDTILKNEDAPPIILIQGDHGPRAHRGKHKETYFPGERFPILSAYYLPPPGDVSTLYPSITPVNSFRLIFNQYLGTELPLLEDRNIAHSGKFGVKDITEQVQQEVAEIVGSSP